MDGTERTPISKEIERRFLVPLEEAEKQASGRTTRHIEQCYLQDTGAWQVRSRKILENGEESYVLTMKRGMGHGESHEIELPGDAETHDQIRASAGAIAKRRTLHTLSCGNVLELDIYEDLDILPGHAVAEVELPSIDAEVDLPEWLGREITGEKGTSNHALFLLRLQRGDR